MRNFLLLLSLFIVLPAIAQTAKVSAPQAARDHFAQAYPKATEVEWKQGKQVKARFKLKGEGYSAYYTTDGAWTRTEHNVKKTELPVAVQTALQASKYGKWKIEDAEEHSTPAHPSIFKVKVENETAKAELFFAPDGKLVRVETKAKKAD